MMNGPRARTGELRAAMVKAADGHLRGGCLGPNGIHVVDVVLDVLAEHLGRKALEELATRPRMPLARLMEEARYKGSNELPPRGREKAMLKALGYEGEIPATQGECYELAAELRANPEWV